LSLRERAGLAVLRRLDPETAHDLAMVAIRAGLAPRPGPLALPRLATDLAEMRLVNPIGLAAGFDKNARAVPQLAAAGFGFLEVGAATPRPQPGNPRPRLFRLAADRAAINRYGFNNDGAEAIARRLATARCPVPVGLNLGTNKGSPDRARDYAEVLRAAGDHVDFATVNVSSPNTERLRDLQGAEALAEVLNRVFEARAGLARRVPIFVKIAPDIAPAEIEAVAGVAERLGLDGIVATNSTLARDGLHSAHGVEKGGLSGAPLFDRATRVLARLSQATDGRVPLIGVGGVFGAEDAYAKIRAGATAVQLYTALTYRGLALVGEIATGLDRLLARDGFSSVAEAVGTGRDEWL